jgi:hypothetical protein
MLSEKSTGQAVDFLDVIASRKCVFYYDMVYTETEAKPSHSGTWSILVFLPYLSSSKLLV